MEEEQPHDEWLDGLSVGAQVVVQRGVNDAYVATVTKVLPSQIVVGTTRFNRQGRSRGGDAYYRSTLLRPTPRLVAKITHRNDAQFLRSVNWERLSPELLATVRRMVEEARETARALAAVDPVGPAARHVTSTREGKS